MGKPEYELGVEWDALMAWILGQQCFRENLKLAPGGETGPVNDLLRSTPKRTGADIMGKRMFDRARSPGQRRHRFTRRPACLPTRDGNPGRARRDDLSLHQ
ncbi:MAG: deaminase [Ramlibacter sp.]|jgi:hypothetical protein|uniref:hypothetical protein n=1 Tax=Ramlibacter sp. TaxID=1917967 RepID=UPI002636D045|nr:hypothetical protein [Ramlibacter sp.]MDB5752423.1 deaminase [Ramlibacter sp.]